MHVKLHRSKHALDLMQDELHTCADVIMHLREIIIL